MQILRSLIPLLLVSMLLAACGGDAQPAAEQPTAGGEAAPTSATGDAPEPTAAPTTGRTSNYDSAATKIVFWVMPNGPQPLPTAQAQAEKFTQTHPDIGVEVQLVDWSVAYNQIQAALQGGADACVTQIGTTWVSGFHPLGGLRPFTAEEIASVGGEAAFVPASWTATRMAGSDEVIAIPWIADVRALAYRQDILDGLGLKPEDAFKDIEAFEATLARVKEANPNVAPFAHTGRGDWNVIQNSSMFIWNYGGEILTADNSQAAFNSEAAVDAVTVQASLFGKGLTTADAPEINTVQAENKMGLGEVFSVVTGPWLISNASTPADAGGWQSQEARENLAFVQFPTGPGGQYTFVGGSQLGIFRECPHPAEAMQFIQYLTSEQAEVEYSIASGFLPALLAAQENEAFSTPAYEVFKAAAATGKVPPTIVQWGGVENIMKTALEGVWEDVAAQPGTPIDAAKVKARLDAAAQSVDELLAQ